MQLQAKSTISIVKSSNTAHPAIKPKMSPNPRNTKYCPPPATGYAAASSVYARPIQTYTNPAKRKATFDAPAAAPSTNPKPTKISAPTSEYPHEKEPQGVTARRRAGSSLATLSECVAMQRHPAAGDGKYVETSPRFGFEKSEEICSDRA